ncbi:MAG TPA: hypothetical protein VNG53_04000 [Bacteroidia bacterium]|nr:hypothetical protein [Bacteroidia bacterium]
MFIHINREIGIQYYKMANDDIPASIAWMKNFNYIQLEKFKWFFTFLFSSIYLLLTILVTNILFAKKSFLKLCIYVYIALFAVAFVFMGFGYLFHSFNLKGYDLSRSLMHIAQSPFVMMVLIPAFKLSDKKI